MRVRPAKGLWPLSKHPCRLVNTSNLIFFAEQSPIGLSETRPGGRPQAWAQEAGEAVCYLSCGHTWSLAVGDLGLPSSCLCPVHNGRPVPETPRPCHCELRDAVVTSRRSP